MPGSDELLDHAAEARVCGGVAPRLEFSGTFGKAGYHRRLRSPAGLFFCLRRMTKALILAAAMQLVEQVGSSLMSLWPECRVAHAIAFRS